MLDEKKIRRMTRLASYESKEGKEELEISVYYKKDYVSSNVIRALLWVTFGYVLAFGLVCYAYLDAIIEGITLGRIMWIGGLFVGIYLVLMVAYGIGTNKYYKKKHDKAREGAKEFCHGLFLLEKMYEKENM